MDVASLASAMIGAQAGRLQMAVAAKMLKMDADNQAAVAKLLDASQQNLANLSNAAQGLGQNLDITV